MGAWLLNKWFNKLAILVVTDRYQRTRLLLGIPFSFVVVILLLSHNPPLGFTILFAFLGFGNLIVYSIIKWIKYKKM
jgi:hypothetical protein